jgi:hypothetical protein
LTAGAGLAALELLEEQREGRDLEFKRGLSRDAKTARTLCVGVTERGGVWGAPELGLRLAQAWRRETTWKRRRSAKRLDRAYSRGLRAPGRLAVERNRPQQFL